MRHQVRSLLVAGSVALVVPLAGCGSGEVTRAEFLDHAVEFSTAAKTSKQKADIRRIFDCVWPEIKKNEALLDEFMSADESNPGLSEQVSKLMVPCLGK